eukprot:1179139-Rhodomonas_salina.1
MMDQEDGGMKRTRKEKQRKGQLGRTPRLTRRRPLSRTWQWQLCSTDFKLKGTAAIEELATTDSDSATQRVGPQSPRDALLQVPSQGALRELVTQTARLSDTYPSLQGSRATAELDPFLFARSPSV